ncbi:MAG: hypothetical protein RLZZ570_629 [Bacteroidota bacterium]|jgi:hypothetical protein
MKNWIFGLLVGAATAQASAQSIDLKKGQWFHALGYDYSIGIDLSTLSMPFASNGVTYAPRFTLPMGDELSLGITAPLGLALTQGQGTTAGLGLGYHYTLAATLQTGLGSTVNSDAWVGAFVNLGYGSFARQVRNYSGIGPAFVRDGSSGVFSEIGVRYDYVGNEVNLSAGLWRVPTSAVDKADVLSIRLLYGFY